MRMDTETISYVLEGHELQNDVQTMIQVFLANRHYIRTDTVTDAEITVKSEMKEGIASAMLYRRGEKASAWSMEYDEKMLTEKEQKRIIKRTIYELLKAETGIRPQWGLLTGVRPAKLISSLLEEGKTDKECLAFLTEDYLVMPHKAALALKVAKAERKILEDNRPEEISLYIGIPFCPTTCLYCSFTSYSLAAYQSKVQPYLEALLKEMKYVSEAMRGRRLDTVYFGGGTPTTLSAGQLDMLLTELERQFDLSACRELTVEAGRPDSITYEKLCVLKAHHVDRISINPQTMNQQTLDLIGRRHTVEQIEEAFALAGKAGLDNINMDMILGLPGENKEMVQHTLEKIKALAPESLTVHSLAIKRAAALNIWREKYLDLQMDNSDEIVSMAADYAHQMGHQPYYMYRQKNMAGNFENVGYSKPGLECIYNILIMEEKQTIIAMGAGASTKIVFQNETEGGQAGRIERIENVKDVTNYIQRIDEMIERKRKFFSENNF